MNLIVEINAGKRCPVERSLFKYVIEKTLLESGVDFFKGITFRVSVALLPPEEMQRINRIYRKHDEVTDVLSFSEYKSVSEIKKDAGKEIFLGEILLCYNDISRYAKSTRVETKKEFVRVLSHGVLHLLGLRHGKKMFSIQTKISAEI